MEVYYLMKHYYAIVEKESEALDNYLLKNYSHSHKTTTSSTSGAKNKIVQTGRNAARNTHKTI